MPRLSSPELNSHPFLLKKTKENKQCSHESPRVKASVLPLMAPLPLPHILSPKSCHFYLLCVSQIPPLLLPPDATTPCRLQLSLD